LASKFLAVFDPERFIVVNGSVERALLSFGVAHEDLEPMEGLKYKKFLEKLSLFIEEARAQHLLPAAALDAFFYCRHVAILRERGE
jgi:hypothetical protein